MSSLYKTSKCSAKPVKFKKKLNKVEKKCKKKKFYFEKKISQFCPAFGDKYVLHIPHFRSFQCHQKKKKKINVFSFHF